jgi:hypothetical protein
MSDYQEVNRYKIQLQESLGDTQTQIEFWKKNDNPDNIVEMYEELEAEIERDIKQADVNLTAFATNEIEPGTGVFTNANFSTAKGFEFGKSITQHGYNE